MQATICKQYRFEAAHQLPNHDGKCANVHGHSYRVELELRGQVRPADGAPDEGMVIDFNRISEAWLPLHARLDHRFLNEQLPEAFLPTTCENVAGFIVAELRSQLPGLSAVRVWETATSWAEATA